MTSLMLRGSESRTIRQPPPAPCITGVCGTRETTADRRLAAGSSRCFPTASAVCRSVQAFDWRRVMALYPKRIEVDARRGRVTRISESE